MPIVLTHIKMIPIYGPLLVLQCVLAPATAPPSAVIDQSQTGDLNVHINLKDLHILALLKGRTEEYVDYDYAYDYSEMTIKPNNSITPRPPSVSNVTTVENATETVTAAQFVTASTTPVRNVTAATPTAAPTNSTTHAASLGVTAATTVASPLAGTTASTPAPKNTTECRKNYVMNKDGECEFTLYDGSTNALLKLVKLSQKLKLRRENRRTNSTEELD